MRAAREPSPENRLVFRSADPAAPAAEMRALVGAVREWPRVLALAEREAATSSLWHAIARHAEAIPAEASEYLAKSALVSDFRMRHLARRLEETVARLAARGTPVLFLKGAAVGAWADPTFRARPMTDVDLLVARDDVPSAGAALEAAEWTAITDPVLTELLRDQQHLPPYVDPRLPGLRLELHTMPLPPEHPFAWGEADLWRESVAAPAPFSGARLPTAEQLLLHTCLHFAWQHTMSFAPWRTFRTVTTVLALPAFDGDRFVALARATRAASSCYWTLRLASRLAAIAVPEGMLAALAPPTPAWARAAIERHFVASLAPGDLPTSPSTWLSRTLWLGALRPRWSGHPAAGRWDPEHRWERARGLIEPETLPARLRRHAADYRGWWGFLVRTLLP